MALPQLGRRNTIKSSSESGDSKLVLEMALPGLRLKDVRRSDGLKENRVELCFVARGVQDGAFDGLDSLALHSG
jgi:hypothetical protein